MIQIPELKDILHLRAGSEGLQHPIRWIYFADCLQCIQSAYRIEDYIHGGEFVVLTNRSLTDDSSKLIDLISRMQEHHIAALGINEGQISDEMAAYCEERSLPLFELPEKFPLVDLSQIICQRLVLEQNHRNSAEQLFTSILDAEHLNRENVFAQARFLHVDLSGDFRVIEFAYDKDQDSWDSLAVGQSISRIVTAEFARHLSENILTQLQTGTVLALVPSDGLSEDQLKNILENIVSAVRVEYHTDLYVGVGNSTGYLEDVKLSRNEAAAAIKVADISHDHTHICFYKDQGLYVLISKITDEKFLDDFVGKNIGRLLRADEILGINLCETLENYLRHNCSVKDTAAAMYLHRNTLNYRLHKIREILGRDLDDIEVCLNLKLAFLIRNYRNMRSKS